MGLTREELYSIANVKQHAELERFLRNLLFKPKERVEFYKRMADNPSGRVLSVDTFKTYFEEYAAERKSNQQDYTPDSVAGLLAELVRGDGEDMYTSNYTGVDPTAGTGSLIIQKWNTDRMQVPPWDYRPHHYFYRVEELADNAIPYLLHNLAYRGMNCIVVHGDTLSREIKQVYFVQNSNDEPLGFSDINVMPHNDTVAKEFDVRKWVDDEIDHIESQKVTWLPGGRMPHKKLECKPGVPGVYEPYTGTRLKDIANVERAKSKKVYPAGTIVIQMSATRGQTGLLTSRGEVPSHYACITLTSWQDPRFMFYYLKYTTPRHFCRVQEGLNLTLDNIETIPIHNWVVGLPTN